MWIRNKKRSLSSHPVTTVHAAVSLVIAHTGLTSLEAQRRLQQYGPNEVVQHRKLSALGDFLVRFKNPLIGILVFAAALSAFFGDATSALIIVAMVVMSVVLDFANTYKSQRVAEALKARVMITATVLRDRQPHDILLREIVPGDVVLLEPGDMIPADGLLSQGKDFFVNESALTGESFPVEKDTNQELAMGTSVVTGAGIMTVAATGSATKFNHIVQTITRQDEPTEFDRSISRFSYLILRATLVLIVFVFGVNALLKHNPLDSFLFALALAVGLTPELLPMIIALNLSKGSIALAKHGIIVKKLSAIQNFGSMDILCTDKTGTLTEDKITLVKYVDGLGQQSDEVLKHAYLSSIFESGFANPLDEAIKAFRNIAVTEYQKVDEVPFDFNRRRSSVVVERVGQRILIAKGAPEELYPACTHYAAGATAQPFTTELFQRVQNEYQSLSQDGFRVLAVATRSVAERKNVYTKYDESGLTLLGYIAFLDPPKLGVGETLRVLERYGLEIKVITGDNELVSARIASDIGLPVRGVLKGADIEQMSDEALTEAVEGVTIFARVAPDQKMRLIETLRKNGHVVGYLGDGINDAPSLKAADVGISVNNAVDVAKETADLILLRKNLHELIQGVVVGRQTFANTLKYLMMSLSSNFGNMFSVAGASFLLPFLPMLPTQILLNNLLYDASQFTIPLDNVDHEAVERPQKLKIGFIRTFMLVFGPLSSLFDLLTFFILYVVFHLTPAAFQTGWFLESLATQTFVIYVVRTHKLPFLQSRPGWLLLMSTIAAVGVGWGIAFSRLGTLFGFTPLTAGPVLSIWLIVGMYLLTVEVAKRWFHRRFQNLESAYH